MLLPLSVQDPVDRSLNGEAGELPTLFMAEEVEAASLSNDGVV